MAIAKTKIWAHLNDDEKMALTLATANGKSTWEAGTIMGKSHYKFLEIYHRGLHFLKLFTQHYQLHKDFFSSDLSIHPVVKTYLDLVMRLRYKPSDAFKKINHPIFNHSKHRLVIFEKELEKWRVSKIPSENLFFDLVMEFDRWNNYRILPRELQEPHAFKRRNKNSLRLVMRAWMNFKDKQPLVLRSLLDLENPSSKGEKKAFVGIITDGRSYQYKVIQISLDKKTLSILKSYKIFAFRKEKEAIDLMNITTDYFAKHEHKSAEGLIFWPIIRLDVQKAINYNLLMGITPHRVIQLKNPYTNGASDREILIKKGIDINK